MTADDFALDVFSTLRDWQEDGFVIEGIGRNHEDNPSMWISYEGLWFEVTVKTVGSP